MDKTKLILMAIQLLMKFLTPELIKKMFEKLVEAIKKFVKDTETTWDDFLFGVLTGQVDKLKVIADTILDFGKNYVLGTASILDDAIFLPIFDSIRTALNIPDND